MRWFGLYSMWMSIGTAFFWMFFNDKTYIALNRAWFYNQIEYFLPAFMGWIFVSLFDSEFMRSTYVTLVTISVIGPFANHWYDLANLWIAGENSYLDSITFWIYFAAYCAFTFFQMIVDIILLPQIYDWADSARIVDNGAKNLLTILF